MKSISEFQNSRLGNPLSINQMVNIKGGKSAEATGASPAGGVCMGSLGCATWSSDARDCGSGCMSYENLHLSGNCN